VVSRVKPKGAAERMRLYRRRRQQGVRYIRIPLHVTDIDDLVCTGRLTQHDRQDQEAIERAVLFLIQETLHDMAFFKSSNS
jgi:hypothetical protein